MTTVTRSRFWLPLLPLLVLLAFVYWLDQQAQQAITQAINHQRHDPDGIMNNFHAITMDLQGTPHILLNAKELRHYPDHDTTELEMPQLTILSREHPAVYINSLRGNISSGGNEVIFQDHVNLLRKAAGDQSAMTLQTEYLRVLPDQDRANTDKPVTMLNAYNTIHAVGLEMDNKTRILKLLSQVRSVHHAK